MQEWRIQVFFLAVARILLKTIPRSQLGLNASEKTQPMGINIAEESVGRPVRLGTFSFSLLQGLTRSMAG